MIDTDTQHASKEEISKRSFQHRMKELHTHSYLTLLSIGQAVAFHLLVEHVYEANVLYGLSHNNVTSWVNFLLALETFAILILVWNDYYMLVSCFSWVPSIIDPALMFCVFASEVCLVKTLDHPEQWFQSVTAFFVVGVLAFTNTMKQSGKRPENDVMLALNRKRMHASVWTLTGMAVISAGVSFFVANINWAPLPCALFVLFVMAGFTWISIVNWSNVIAFVDGR